MLLTVDSSEDRWSSPKVAESYLYQCRFSLCQVIQRVFNQRSAFQVSDKDVNIFRLMTFRVYIHCIHRSGRSQLEVRTNPVQPSSKFRLGWTESGRFRFGLVYPRTD